MDDAAIAGGTRPGWAPTGINLDTPNVARMYDYYLGGAHNFSPDRDLADRAIADWPDLPLIMRANRAFLRRAVRYLVGVGIRQFLDLGSGIPTVGNVHEVAQAEEPSCRVVYVDIDSVAVSHSQAILARNSHATAVQADLRDPEAVLAHPDVRGLLDLSQPVGMLLVAVAHFIPDSDDPAGIIGRYREALAPGSYLAICHASSPVEQPKRAATHQALYSHTATPMTMRSQEQIAALLAGWELVEPGLVFMAEWRPDGADPLADRPEAAPGYAGVARRPAPAAS